MLHLVVACLLFAAATAHGDDALAPGRVLDASTASAAETLMAPEVLAHYKAGQYKNTIAAWPTRAAWEDAFAAASKANAARYDANDRGTIVDRATGKPATGIYGLPFRVEAQDSPRSGDDYDVTADGQRFLFNTSIAQSNLLPLTTVVNWTADLRR